MNADKQLLVLVLSQEQRFPHSLKGGWHAARTYAELGAKEYMYVYMRTENGLQTDAYFRN